MFSVTLLKDNPNAFVLTQDGETLVTVAPHVNAYNHAVIVDGRLVILSFTRDPQGRLQMIRPQRVSLDADTTDPGQQ